MASRNRNRMKDTETETRATDAEQEQIVNSDTEQTDEKSTVSEVVSGIRERIEAARATEETERAKLDEEILKRENELDALYELRGFGREGQKKPRRLAAKREGVTGSDRINWDEKLARLPKTFTVDDMLKDAQIAAKGKVQCYPAVGRWIKQDKVKQLDRGRWRRNAA